MTDEAGTDAIRNLGPKRKSWLNVKGIRRSSEAVFAASVNSGVSEIPIPHDGITTPPTAELLHTYRTKQGPNFVRVVDVTYFGAKGDGTDATQPIEDAIRYSKTQQLSSTVDPGNLGKAEHQMPVYFPAGTYLISRPLNIEGCVLVGEAAGNSGASDSILRATGTNGSFGATQPVLTKYPGLTKFPGKPLLFAAGPPGQKYSSGHVQVRGLHLDANEVADYGLVVVGNTIPVVEDVVVRNTRLDGFVFNLPNAKVSRVWTAGTIGRHSFHIVDANGLSLSEFDASGYAARMDGSALFIEGTGLSSFVWISNGSFGPHGIGNPGTDRNTVAVHCKGLRGSIISNLYIEAGRSDTPVLLESCQFVALLNNRITAASASKDACMIRLRGDGTSNIQKQSTTNTIRGNLGGGWSKDTDRTWSPWAYDAFANHTERIVIEKGCVNNHISDNLRLHANGAAMSISYAYDDYPSKLNPGKEDIPTQRNHTVGQEHAITYSPAAPTSGTWYPGDIVFNSAPSVNAPVGWVFVHHSGEAKGAFKPFALVGDDAKPPKP